MNSVLLHTLKDGLLEFVISGTSSEPSGCSHRVTWIALVHHVTPLVTHQFFARVGDQSLVHWHMLWLLNLLFFSFRLSSRWSFARIVIVLKLLSMHRILFFLH